MKILIIGANGFIGSNLIKKIRSLRKDIQITALVNGPDLYGVQKFKGVSFLLFDFRENISSYINSSYDVIINLAWVGVNGPDKRNVSSQKKNILFTKALLIAAKKQHVKKIIFSGTITEHFHNLYSDPNINNNAAIVYGYFKNKAKELCKHFGSSLNILWLQFANVYGVNNLSGNILSNVIKSIIANKPIQLSDGNQYYDFIHVDDLTNAIEKSLNISVDGFEELYLGSGKPRLLRDYLLEIGALYNAINLLEFGKRANDGLVFDKKWMDNTKSVDYLGDYIQKSFSERIRGDLSNNKSSQQKPICIYHSFLHDASYIIPFVQNDNRGFFVKDYQRSKIKTPQYEHFYTFSKKNVIRGMHFQPISEQGKIVSCLNGAILDVIVDLRKSSPTFLQKQYAILSDNNHMAIYVPPGFAHGFLALKDSTVLYRCSKEFNPDADFGFQAFDKTIDIAWGVPFSKVTMSKKDSSLCSLVTLLEGINK